MARLVEALYVFVHVAKSEFFAHVIQPALHGSNILAPTEKHRKDFAMRYLRVWAKPYMIAHERFALLVLAFKVCLPDVRSCAAHRSSEGDA